MSASEPLITLGASEAGLPGDLAGFRNRHKNSSVIVCGCGESLNSLIDPRQFITIGVNDIGRRFDPDYLVVLNPKNQFSPERFQYIRESRASAVFTQLHLPIRHAPVIRFKLGKFAGTDFSNPNVLHYTRNSPYVALCLAVHMGATRIGLIGVDFTDHHFFRRSGRHPLAHRLNAINKEYRALYDACRASGVEIVNLSPASRITAFPKMTLEAFSQESGVASTPVAANPLNIVSYATTPVAGVPSVLARCIQQATAHRAECVWESGGYGNGVVYGSDGIEWKRVPGAALEALRAADLLIVHNGKVHPRHKSVVAGKPVITMAHNYLWNVDRQFVDKGMPGVVVGQYQAVLPEFENWSVVPNPMPLWEPAYQPAAKPGRIAICYTPSAKHERYPRNHRLYWHGKGYKSTMRVLERLAKRYPLDLYVIRERQLSHEQVLDMKRRSHIVIDECVTGSYHRNSLEGLATGCIVVNGFGMLEGIGEVFDYCTGGNSAVPFVSSDLDGLEATLAGLIELGADELARRGAQNRRWLERHWSFERQWERFWNPVVRRIVKPSYTGNHASAAVTPPAPPEPVHRAKEGVSVVIPHGGRERFENLMCTLHRLRECDYVSEIIVVESGCEPECFQKAKDLCTRYVFVYNDGAFQRGQTLNIGTGLSQCEYILWLDNDLLVSDGFIRQAVDELNRQRLDFLVPYASIHYLSERDSRAVIDGRQGVQQCKPFKVMRSGRDVIGGAGLVRRRFYLEHGGFESEFRGWGGEDNAWHIKARLFGRMSVSKQSAQCLYHLFHENSGANSSGRTGMQSNPHYADNLALLDKVRRLRSPSAYRAQFPPKPFIPPWRADKRLVLVVDSSFAARQRYIESLADSLRERYGIPVLVAPLCKDTTVDSSGRTDEDVFVAFGTGVDPSPAFRDVCRRSLWIYSHESDTGFHSFLGMEPDVRMVMPFDAATAEALSLVPERAGRYPAPLRTGDGGDMHNLVCAASLTAGTGEESVNQHLAPPVNVWVYWEGKCPEWIKECRKTLEKNAPGLYPLDAEKFDRLWYKDRDINLDKLPMALKADYIRAFLLAHYGGLWVDSDCLVMRPLDELLEKVRTAPFVAHRERSGLVSNAFIGACRGSALAKEYYRRVCEVLRSGCRIGWTSLGSKPLTELLNNTDKCWHELECEAIQPVCWSRPETFFAQAGENRHREALRPSSLCYMLSHDRIKHFQKQNPGKNLLDDRTFFRFLLGHALQGPGSSTPAAANAAITDAGENKRRVFQQIHRTQCASNPESVSGPGSCLARTAVIREQLPGVFSRFGIKNVLDAACGDFHWFKEIVSGLEYYTGVDIVPELVEANRNQYASEFLKFETLDISADPLPAADLVFARDCLVHMPIQDIFRTLSNFKASGSRYLMMTTFTKARRNYDIKTGDWRPLNFMRPPFCLSAPLELINERCDEAGGRYRDKSLALWSLDGLSLRAST